MEKTNVSNLKKAGADISDPHRLLLTISMLCSSSDVH